MFNDLRITAVVFAVGGILAGYFLPTSYLFGITAILPIAALFILHINSSSAGTSGGIGLLVALACGLCCFLIPLWLTVLVLYINPIAT